MLAAGLTLTLVLVRKSLALGAAMPLLDAASILCVLAYVAAFELGPGPIPWQIGAEIFPEGPRAEVILTLQMRCPIDVRFWFNHDGFNCNDHCSDTHTPMHIPLLIFRGDGRGGGAQLAV